MRAQASAMCTAAASWRTCRIGSFASSAASNTGITWLPESANSWRVPASARPCAMRSAPRIRLLADPQRGDQPVVKLELLFHVLLRVGWRADRCDAAELGVAGDPVRVLGDAREHFDPLVDGLFCHSR